MHQVNRQTQSTARGKEKRKKTMRVDKSHVIIILFVALLFFRNFFHEIQVKKKRSSRSRYVAESFLYFMHIYTRLSRTILRAKVYFFPFIYFESCILNRRGKKVYLEIFFLVINLTA